GLSGPGAATRQTCQNPAASADPADRDPEAKHCRSGTDQPGHSDGRSPMCAGTSACHGAARTDPTGTGAPDSGNGSRPALAGGDPMKKCLHALGYLGLFLALALTIP